MDGDGLSRKLCISGRLLIQVKVPPPNSSSPRRYQQMEAAMTKIGMLLVAVTLLATSGMIGGADAPAC
jgi:hypothetical protein